MYELWLLLSTFHLKFNKYSCSVWMQINWEYQLIVERKLLKKPKIWLRNCRAERDTTTILGDWQWHTENICSNYHRKHYLGVKLHRVQTWQHGIKAWSIPRISFFSTSSCLWKQTKKLQLSWKEIIRHQWSSPNDYPAEQINTKSLDIIVQ